MGLQGIYKGMERFTWVYKDIQGFTEVIQGITGLYKGFTGAWKGLHGFTRIYKFTEVIQGFTIYVPIFSDISVRFLSWER